MDELLVLEQFEKYLEKRGYSKLTPSGLPSTIYDYAHARIPFVLRTEKIDIINLCLNIDYYVKTYDFDGTKEHLGNKSHRAVINALKRFSEFCKSEIFKNSN